MKTTSSNKIVRLTLSIFVACVVSTSAAGINDRQDRQQTRINQGIATGELTTKEAINMQRQQKRIDRKERRYRKDGVFTKRERIDLHSDLNQTSRRIHRQKHDTQSR